MNDQDKKQFAVLMYGIAEECGGQISKHGIKLKFEALKTHPIEVILKAASWLVQNRENTFPAIPTVKEFLDAIKAICGETNPKTEGERQCDIVMKYFNYYGSYCDHEFKDPITAYLMTNRWSFKKLGEMMNQELSWFRKNFVQSYVEMKVLPDEKLLDYNGIDAEKLKSLAAGAVKQIT